MAQVTFDILKKQWLQEIEINVSPTLRSMEFARKLFSQWRDLTEGTEELIYFKSSLDIGFDLAFFEEADVEEDVQPMTTLFVVQSKFGLNSYTSETLLSDGERAVSSLSDFIIGNKEDNVFTNKLNQFIESSDKEIGNNKIIFIIATDQALTQSELKVIDSVRSIGKDKIGPFFDIENISIETIYFNVIDDFSGAPSKLKLKLLANLASSGTNVLVGSVTLPNLYEFLKAYRNETGDLDQLYERNVRKFLGTRRKINRQMKDTLINDPSHFGLFNNGITIVARDFEGEKGIEFVLTDPYIVNGCQTTKTIWDVFSQRYDVIKIGDTNLNKWKISAETGIVVVKVVKVGSSGEELLEKITRYTNSQNAVSEKDFITLEKGFQALKREMSERYNVYLEIQRGGWESQLAFQAVNPDTFQYKKHANAFDLLKVFGAGWFREAGTAFGRNMSFVPGGSLYKKILNGIEGFGVDDLYAAFHLENAANTNDFGRGAKLATRRLTRYLFYMIFVELLKDVMIRSNLPTNNKLITKGIISLAESTEAFSALVETAVGVVDEYLTQGEEESVFNEPEFLNRFNKNINGYLKWNLLGRQDSSPHLHSLLAINKRTMGRGQPSPRDLIMKIINGSV